jgi:hypothetical protein
MGLSHEHKENIAGYFAYASDGSRWGPKHWPPPRQRTVTTMAEPNPDADEPEVEGGEELARQARDWLAMVHNLPSRARPPSSGGFLDGLTPTERAGYLRHHPWEARIEERVGGECWLR